MSPNKCHIMPRRSGMMGLRLMFDGAARNNPGEAACAAVIIAADGRVLAETAKGLGTATCNVAE